MLMLMHVGCGTMKCGSTTALVMAVGFLLPSQVIKEPALVMQSNVTITSHKRTSFGNAN